MIGYIIFQILPAVAALAYTLYLAHARFDTSHRKAVEEKAARKYKGTPFYDMHMKLYSTQALVLWMFVTVILALDAI